MQGRDVSNENQNRHPMSNTQEEFTIGNSQILEKTYASAHLEQKITTDEINEAHQRIDSSHVTNINIVSAERKLNI